MTCSSTLLSGHALAAPDASSASSAPTPPPTLNSLQAPEAPTSATVMPSQPDKGPVDNSLNNFPMPQPDVNNKTKAEKEAEADRRDADEHWLVRSYEQQLRSRSATDSADKDSVNASVNLYDTIASDKQLAKLAGIKPSDAANLSKLTGLKALDPHAKSPLTLRSDDDDGSNSPSKDAKKKDDKNDTDKSADAAKHLLPFLSAPTAADAAGLHDFYSSLPTTAMPDGTGTKPNQLDTLAAVANAAPDGSSSSSTSTVDMPGLTAQSGPDDKVPGAMAIDVLPGESLADAMKHQDNFSVTVPDSSASSQLQTQQMAQLSLPVPKGTESPLPISPLLLNPTLDQKVQAPVVTPMPTYSHSKVADPFDYLNNR